MSDESFRHMEYKLLREWVVTSVIHRRRLLEVCVISVTAFYAFVFINVRILGPSLFPLSLYLPGLIVVLGVFRWIGILTTISNHCDRMVAIEFEIAPDKVGIEVFMRDLRSRRFLKGGMELYSEAFTWALLGFLCLMIFLNFRDSYDALAALVVQD